MQPYINHISRDYSIIHSTNLNDPILIIYAMFNIIQNQNKVIGNVYMIYFVNYVQCFMSIKKKLFNVYYNICYLFMVKCIEMVDIQPQKLWIYTFNFAAICQKSVPYIDFNNMRISLTNNIREQSNPCKWLFELRDIDQHLIDILNCITQLLTEQKYTHCHLNAYINFCAKCITNNNNDDDDQEKIFTIYKFATVICESLLTYPLAFGSLLRQQNIAQDIQKLVKFAMLNTKKVIPNLLSKDNINDTSWTVLNINNSRLTVLAIKDGINKTTFKCPLNIIICMLYIIAYCKNPLNGINSWLTFIVSKELKLQILLDSATSNHLQKCLPEELRWKLLLKYDNLQLYCFVYRISNMQSLCNIIPFLLDHKFDTNTNTNTKPTSAFKWSVGYVMMLEIKMEDFVIITIKHYLKRL